MLFRKTFAFFTTFLLFSSLVLAEKKEEKKELVKIPQEISLSMVATTAIDQTHPFDIFSGKAWRASANAEYVKLHLYFDTPFELSGVEVKSCEAKLKSPVNLFINFDSIRYSVTPQNGMLTQALNSKETRSLTFNFLQNTGVCISEIHLLNPSGKPYKVLTPELVQANVQASSTANPNSAYDVMNLFDSRYEYAWSANRSMEGQFLNFEFNQKQRIEKLKIWNGYQRSDVHCFSNPRAKVLVLEGDEGFKTEVEIQDIMGSQEVVLPKVFTGKVLKINIKEVYPGKKFQDLSISELRFYNGKKWFLPNPVASMKKNNDINLESFKKSDLDEILNRSLSSSTSSESLYRRWNFRFRSDGSMYVQGNQNKAGRYEDFYALGNYEVKQQDKNLVKLRIFGFLRKLEGLEGDCNGCGRDCNQANSEEGLQEKIFEDLISIRRMENGKYIIQNEGKVKMLSFDKMSFSLENEEGGDNEKISY